MGNHRTLCHEQEYADALDALGAEDARYYDHAAGLEWGIATKAECYPLLPASLGVPGLRLAPGDAFADLAPVRIFFAIDGDNSARLLYIETVPLEDVMNGLG